MRFPVESTNGRPEPGSGLSESKFPLLNPKIPTDAFNFAYIIHFTLGLGFLLPWNAFITAVDYFSRLYPSTSVDRILAAVYMPTQLICLLLIVLFFAHKSESRVRINLGLGLFVVALLIVPVTDWVYVKGRVGIYPGFYVTAAAIGLAGVADALMQGGLVGAAGELPERYMQAVVAGTAGSGVLVSFLRILTKAVFPQDADGLRKSANLYFAVSIIVMIICSVLYNIAQRLPVMKYYQDLKCTRATTLEPETKDSGPAWRKTLWQIIARIKWRLFALVLVYTVTLSIYPGCVTEDVKSEILNDWFPLLLITAYNVSDLLGKSLTGLFLVRDEKTAVWGCVGRVVFYPMFWVCLNGPGVLRTEIPVTVLTCLLGFTNGYFSSSLMIMAPKSVELKHSEAAGIVVVLFLILGLAIGSVLAWVWVI